MFLVRVRGPPDPGHSRSYMKGGAHRTLLSQSLFFLDLKMVLAGYQWQPLKYNFPFLVSRSATQYTVNCTLYFYHFIQDYEIEISSPNH